MPKEDDKTVNQQIIISQAILDLMSKFSNMVNDCIRIGLQNSVTSLKILSMICHLVIDRDVLAALNIAKKGDDVFHSSKCLSGEAMVVESCLFPKVIHQVDERKSEAYVS